MIPGIGPCYLPGETPAPAAHCGTLRHSRSAQLQQHQLTSHTRHRPSGWPSFQWSPRPKNGGPRRPRPPHWRSPKERSDRSHGSRRGDSLLKSYKKKAIEVGIPWDTTKHQTKPWRIAEGSENSNVLVRQIHPLSDSSKNQQHLFQNTSGERSSMSLKPPWPVMRVMSPRHLLIQDRLLSFGHQTVYLGNECHKMP